MFKLDLFRPTGKRRAQTLVEFALTAMVFVLLLVMIIEVARLLAAYVILQHAARTGARYAITGDWDTNYSSNPSGHFNISSTDPYAHIAPCWPLFDDDPLSPTVPGYTFYQPWRNARTCSVEAATLRAMTGLPLDPRVSTVASPQWDVDAPGYYEIVVMGVADDASPNTGTFVRNGTTVNYSDYYPSSFAGNQTGFSRGFAGAPEEKVVVQIQYRLPIVAPILNAIAPSVRLTATAIMTNEAFGSTSLQRQAAVAPSLPPVPVLEPPTPADLTVKELVLKTPPALSGQYIVGQDVEFDVTVENIGVQHTPTSSTFYIRVYASPTQLSPETTPLAGVTEIAASAEITERVLSGSTLGPISVTGQLNIPIGTWYLYAWVDAPSSLPGTATNAIDEVGTGSMADPAREENNAKGLPTSIEIVQAADLAVSKEIIGNPDPMTNENVVYRVTVTNMGPNDAMGVQLSDVLPSAQLTYQSHTADRGTYTPGSGQWDIGDLPRLQTATLEITALVTAAMGQTVINEAKDLVVGSGMTEIQPLNNQDSVAFTVGAVDLAVTKVLDNPTPTIGSVITYTVTITNTNPTNGASGIVVQDLLPPATWLTYLSFTPSVGTFDSGTGNWAVGNLAGGASATLTIQARVLAAAVAKTVTNTATITARTEPDPNPANDTASVTFTIEGADLSVVKTVPDVADQTPIPGQTITYNIRVSNLGPDPATGVSITDVLPATLTYVTSRADRGVYNSATGVWTIGPVNKFESVDLEIDAIVNTTTAVGTVITNTTSNLVATQADPDPANNVGTVNVTVRQPTADLQVTKTVDRDHPASGQQVVYTLTVRNLGPDQATGVALTDLLPAGADYVSHTASTGTTYDNVTGLWTIGTLNLNATVTLTITALVNAPNNTTVTNITSNLVLDQADNNSANNVGSASFIASNIADVSVTKTVSPSTIPFVGSWLTYTVTVTNAGPSPATGVFITDVVPAGLTLQSATASQGTYNSGTGVWNVGTVPAGSSRTLTLRVTVNNGTEGTTITNTAELTAMIDPDPDSTPGNNIPSEDDQASVSIVPRPRYMFINLGTGTPNCPTLTWGVANEPGLPYLLGSSNMIWLANLAYQSSLGWGWESSSPDWRSDTQTVRDPAGNPVDATTTTLFSCRGVNEFSMRFDNLSEGNYRIYLAFSDPNNQPRRFDVYYKIGTSVQQFITFDSGRSSNEYEPRTAFGRYRLGIETFTVTLASANNLYIIFENGDSVTGSRQRPWVQGIGIELLP